MLAAIRRTPGTSQAAVAAWLEVEAITAGRMVDRLEKAGLVARRADPADRRTWHLFLTPLADCQMDRLATFAEGVFDEALSGFSQDEHTTLLALLDRVRANLSATMPDDAGVAQADLQSMAHG
jgi:DNA-binding MarR family transcriptional regulator